MVKIRKLTEAEVAEVTRPKAGPKGPSKRQMILEEYKAYLEGLKSGDWAAVELEESDRRLTVRNRLKRAAKELGCEVVFKRSRGPVVYFQVK